MSQSEITVACANCDWEDDISACNHIRDYSERVELGGEAPAGECPECGALAFIAKGQPSLTEEGERGILGAGFPSMLPLVIASQCAFFSTSLGLALIFGWGWISGVRASRYAWDLSQLPDHVFPGGPSA